MDMEMNAELERDGGSESGDVSTDGSSAGSVYVSLEQDFARITGEMKKNPELASYEAEYTRLFESLYKAHRLEEQLTEKCNNLKEEVDGNAIKITNLEKKIRSDSDEIEKLKQEIYDGKKLADAAHTREQKAQEVIENLRLSIAKLTEELTTKSKQFSSDDHSATNKTNEGLTKERERLFNEVEVLRQRVKALTSYNKEIDQKLSEAEQHLSDLQDKFDKLSTDFSREKREKEKLESEYENLNDELKMRLQDLKTAEESLKTSASNAAKQETMLREQAHENEKNQKEIQKLMLRQMQMKTEADRMEARFEEMRKELYEKNRDLQSTSKELYRTKDEVKKLRIDKESLTKKNLREHNLYIKSEENLKRMTANLKRAEVEITSLNRQLQTEKMTIDKMTRDKDFASKNITNLEELNKKSTLELKVLEQTNRKLESSLEEMMESMNELKRQLKNVEQERDRCILESQALEEKVEDCKDEVKMKQLEMSEVQKRLKEAETKFRQQQSLFEEVRAERNTYKKNLSLALSDFNELKEKFKKLTTDYEQLGEKYAEKESALLKQEFLFTKTEKEKEALKSELATSRKNMSALREEMAEMKQLEKQLRDNLQEADLTIARQRKEIESVMKERDIIGTQIVRRNDEVSLQHSKIQVLSKTLERGEQEYAQRMREIKMLQLEIKKLRLEKESLEKDSKNLVQVRGELFNAERRIAKERMKVTALEEEMQSPLNVHRWRNLEATDPDTFELLQKIHILQKRIMKMSAEMIAKDKKIKDTEELYMNLREIIAKQPGPEVLVCLTKTKRALRNRSKKMKCLMAELNMTLTAEHKFELDKVKRELELTKAKYLSQKRKNQKAAMAAKDNESLISKQPNKFHGGGYSLTTTSPLAKAEYSTENDDNNQIKEEQ